MTPGAVEVVPSRNFSLAAIPSPKRNKLGGTRLVAILRNVSTRLMIYCMASTCLLGIHELIGDCELIWCTRVQVLPIGAFKFTMRISPPSRRPPISPRSILALLILTVLGMFLTNFCTTYWQLQLPEGLLPILGCGYLSIPGVAVLPTYCIQKRWAGYSTPGDTIFRAH